MNPDQRIIAISAFIVFLILVGFGASVAKIYDDRNYYIPSHESCPTFPELNEFEAVKHYDQWTWRYKVRNDVYNARVEHYCPTAQHDTNVFINGKFAGRSDGKIATTVSKTYVRDCHGKKKYVMRTGNTFETIVNMNKIFVSFELREYNNKSSGDQNDVIAYVEQFNFFTNEYTIKDKFGTSISKLYMNKYQAQWWTWEFTIYNQSHPAGNPLILLMIAGKSSFSETTKDDEGNEKYNTDICNSYFWTTSLIIIIILCIIGFFVVSGIIIICVKMWENRNRSGYGNYGGYRLFN